jgi:hypothetical protein
MSTRTQQIILAVAIAITSLVILFGLYYNLAILTGMASIVLLIEIALVAPVFEKVEW